VSGRRYRVLSHCRGQAEYNRRLLAPFNSTNYRSLMFWLKRRPPIPRGVLLARICVLLKNSKRLNVLRITGRKSGMQAFQIAADARQKSFCLSNLMKDVVQHWKACQYISPTCRNDRN